MPAAPSGSGAMAAPRQQVAVVWFKTTDLRTHDHEPLSQAHASGLAVLHLFVFDPRWYGKTRLAGFPRTGPGRARFQLQALDDLAGRLSAAGHALTVRQGATGQVFRELCADFDVKAVHASREVCSEELRVEAAVREVLKEAGAQLQLHWTYELHHHADLPEDVRRKGASGFSGYRRCFSERVKVRPPLPAPDLGKSAPGARWSRGEALPADVTDLGLPAATAADSRAEVQWHGGETAGLERVREYFFGTDAISLVFSGATNFPHDGHSSTKHGSLTKLSPWMSHGCISARWLYAELQRYERERRKSESTARLVHELYFRDFVRFSSLLKGSKIFRLEGIYGRHPPGGWLQDSEQVFDAWRQGKTGFPFVDASLRELEATGHCCHAGREVAAWFLVADLGLDWRLGAEWFESMLVDYEPASNWFNWAFTIVPRATGGNSIQEEAMPKQPPRTRLQTPEVVYWAAQHDPDAEYIKRWVPELKDIEDACLAREPWRATGAGSAAPRVGTSAPERPPPVARERDRIGWVRRTFPAGGADVQVWWACMAGGGDPPAEEEVETRVDPEDEVAYTLEQLRAKYTKQYKASEIEEYWRNSCALADLRVDPSDGKAYSLPDLLKKYQRTYRRWEIEDYFAKTCRKPAPPARKKLAPKANGPPEGWPNGYALPLLPPASLEAMEEVAEQSRRNQARKAQKAAMGRKAPSWVPDVGKAPEGAPARSKRWSRAIGA